MYEPEIAQNAGTLVRLCACFNIPIGIIEPASFVFNNKKFKRSGMDYINKADINLYESFSSYQKLHAKNRTILLDVKATTMYYDFQFDKTDCLLVGTESTGVPSSVFTNCTNQIKIPMNSNTRSLNVAISAAIVLAEALRQLDYFSLK